ncbi:(2,3-dihydroxybenzoyl)adenylate synthase [Lentzea sp. NPDC051213]|uniref:(2,3-dihydroxybenzoyl)adenylate synthase n=1 Tax=Lentzea sp. NPDC051213 TaxID=3364126 RepID=UPI003798B1F4
MTPSGLVTWPEDRVTAYRLRGHWRGRTLGSLVTSWADCYGSEVAVVDDRRQLTYLDLAAEVDVLAERLLGLGLRPGDSIVVQLPNCAEFVVLMLACARVGVVPTMMLTAHREHELTHIARHVTAKAIAVPGRVHGYDHQALARRVAADCDDLRHVLVAGEGVEPGHVDLRKLMSPDSQTWERRNRLDALAPDASDVALFLLSGGTTGVPKVIPRTHNDYEYAARHSARVCGFDRSTVYLVALPAAHTFPLGSPGLLGTLMNGGRVVLVPSPRPEVAFEAIATHRVTVAAAVPAVVQRWIESSESAEWDLSSLRLLQVGGSRLSRELAMRIRPALRCALQQVYGMSEGLLNFTRLDDPAEAVVSTQGRPMSADDEIRIVDEHGRQVEDGDAGELLVRGPTTIPGYFRVPEHNAECFTADGWYHTGDIVRRHSSGNLVVESRVKDVINRGGEKIHAEEIEDVLNRMPQVARAAAVAAPHRELSEVVCACVVLEAGQSITLEEIRDYFDASGMAAFKFPERLEVLDEMPLTPVGKIRKQSLRELAAGMRTLRQVEEVGA